MTAIMRWGGGLVALLLISSISNGYEWVSPVFRWPLPVAPDACGPGWYVVNNCGMVYGPNYYLVPPGMPFNGLLPGPKGQALMNAQAGIPPWMAQAQGQGGPNNGPGYALRPPYPPNTPYTANTPYPPQAPYAANTPWPPYPPGTPVPPGRMPVPPNAPNAPNAPVPDNRTTTGVYPTHPYIRAPRDFFMWNEAMEDTRGRDVRPNLVAP